MYTDIIHYKLAEGVTTEQLLTAAKDIYESWMATQDGFMHWQINTLSDGGFVDIVQWESESAAKKAEASMQTDIDQSNPWFACYDMTSIRSQKATQLEQYGQ